MESILLDSCGKELLGSKGVQGRERLIPNRTNYIFFDEIQHVESFEKAVDSLFLRENCDVYITGSNTWLMSGGIGNTVDRTLCGAFHDALIFCQGSLLVLSEFFSRMIVVQSVV